MSTPRSLTLPDGVRRVSIAAPHGLVAALVGEAARPRGTAVLVHGFNGSKEDFIHLLPVLAERGWSTVAIDQRGHHETPDPRDADAYDVSTFAGDLVDVIAGLGSGPAHVVGHSFGGLVVRAAALAAPLSMRSLTLLCTGPSALPEHHHAPLGLYRAAMATVGHDPVWDFMRGEAVAADPQIHPHVLEFLELRFRNGSPQALDAAAATLVGEPDRVAELAALQLPLMVARGEHDDEYWSPAVQDDMARRLGTSVVVIDGAGHSPAVDDPELTATVLDAFWTSVDPR